VRGCDHGTLAGDESGDTDGTGSGKRRTTDRRTSRSGSVPPIRRQLCGRCRLTIARSYYYNDALSGALPLGQCGTRALPYHSHTAAISEGQRASVFGTDVDATLLTTDGGYVSAESLFWAVSGRQVFDASAFYLPTSGIDPFGNTTTIAYDTHDLFVTSMTDAIGNVVTVSHDYRVLAPDLITDPNGNRSAVSFDIRGVVVASALMGKVGASEGDTLADPTSTSSYDVFAWRDNSEPIWVRTQARETFGSPTTRWLTRYVYTDGSGNPILEKVNAEAGLAPERDAGGALVLDSNDDPVLVQSDPRWVGTGRTVFDNKGNAVKQYEPYFSSTEAYEGEEELREQGATPLLHYDPLGRLIRTEYPDGTESRVEFSPWHVEHWDRNDTAGGSTWYSTRVGLPVGDLERVAAESTDDHHDTPMVTRFDAQGRPVVSVADLGGGTTYLTRVELDIEGNVLTVTDARDNTAQTSVHGMLGQVLETDSVDAGERRSMVDVMGTPLRAFDDPTLSRVHRWEYDALRRPTHHWVLEPPAVTEQLVTRTVYGETATSPQTNNLRGRTLRMYDGAGLLESVAFDFAGNLLEQERTLMDAHDVVPDWVTLANETMLSGLDTAAASLLDTEVFTTEGTFDAFGRPVTRTTPDGSVTRYGYNDAGLLESVSADVRGATPATDFVDNIDYDVHGRLALIEYANGTSTTYEYDPLSFRLMRVTTERDSDSAVMQDLQYVYDAVGNITSITDGAQQTLYFDNAVVTPDQTFEYDALYRLVEATGREHTSQGQPTESELTPGAQPEASDPAAMRTYTESYTYDEVGNLTLVEHVATGGNWSRGYDYATDGNRLLSTSLPGDTVGTPATYSASYTHDDHGNMTAMPHLSAIDWDYAQRMQHADLGGGGDVWFQYDAAGNRVRKVQVNSAGTAANERIYLGGVEVYRQRDVVSGALDAVNDERETLHISDDAGRIAMVETLTIDGGTVVSSPANVARYQYGNHLGTVALELDDSAAVISYEEFHPYGGSAYRAVDSTIGVSAKRYRYAGLERDEETGLDHMGARYYAPWLGRWTAADPIGLGDGVNRYAYVSGNPVRMTDPSGTRGGEAAELQQQRARAHDVRERAIHDATTMLNAASQELARAGSELIAASQSAAANPGNEDGALRVHYATFELRQAQIGLDAANEGLRQAYSQGYLEGDPVGQGVARAGALATAIGETQAAQAKRFDNFAFQLENATKAAREIGPILAEPIPVVGDAAAAYDVVQSAKAGDYVAAAVGLAAIFVGPTVARRLTGSLKNASGSFDDAARARRIHPHERGGGGRLSSEAAAFDRWSKGLPTKQTPTNKPADRYEIAQTGSSNFQLAGGGEVVWSDGLDAASMAALEAKYVGRPSRSPFISGSDVPDFIRDKITSQVTDEFRRYGAVIADPSNPVRQLTVIINDDRAAPFFEDLMRNLDIPGQVVVR